MEYVNFKVIGTEKVYYPSCKGKATTLYLANCIKCDKIIKTQSGALKTHSGKCRKCVLSETKGKRKRPYEYLYNLLISPKYNKDIPVEITYHEFLEFTKINNCHYCDDSIVWIKHHNKGPLAFNLDRKINELGHTKDNMVVCCAECNWTKQDLYTYEEFIEFIPVLKKIKIKRKTLSTKNLQYII